MSASTLAGVLASLMNQSQAGSQIAAANTRGGSVSSGAPAAATAAGAGGVTGVAAGSRPMGEGVAEEGLTEDELTEQAIRESMEEH